MGSASPIGTLPPEILSAIFGLTEIFPPAKAYATPVLLSHVCRPWRAAALDDSSLWLDVCVRSKDTKHMSFLLSLLERSKGRPITIGMNFSDLQWKPALNESLLYRLLKIVIEHIPRTRRLYIRAQPRLWSWIVVAFATQKYDTLTVLDLEAVLPAPHRFAKRRTDAISWDDTSASIAGDLIVNPHPAPTATTPLVFPFPKNHRHLRRLRLIGISIGTIPLPPLEYIRLGGNTPLHIIVGEDGRLTRRLLNSAPALTLEDMPIPDMPSYVPLPIASRVPVSPVRTLSLRRLRASVRYTPDVDGLYENDCRPFFDALYTPRARCLLIERWDLRGRAWADFLDWLPEELRFPEVSDLRIFGMHFNGMDYEELAFFLDAFPSLRHLRIEDCLPGTWEAAVETLEMFPDVCPRLRAVRLNDTWVIRRGDPFPFRGAELE